MTRNTDVLQRSACLSLLIVSLGVVGGCNRGGEKTEQAKSPEQPAGEVPQQSKQVELRVRVDDLKELLDAGRVRILDVRPEQEYEQGHVPGAVRVNADAWKEQALKDDGGGLTDKDAWQKLIRRLGVNDATQVIVYSDNVPTAARIWWTLKYLGVEQAGILDGGWQHWLDNGGESSTDEVKVEQGDFTIDSLQTDRLIQIGELKEAFKEMQIVDARTEGEVQAGKIPGAVHLEWGELVNADGTFKSDDDLKALFASRELDPARPAATYCQSGGRAAAEAYALELAGFKDVKNYYCSWQQWGVDESAPREKPE